MQRPSDIDALQLQTMDEDTCEHLIARFQLALGHVERSDRTVEWLSSDKVSFITAARYALDAS